MGPGDRGWQSGSMGPGWHQHIDLAAIRPHLADPDLTDATTATGAFVELGDQPPFFAPCLVCHKTCVRAADAVDWKHA